MYTIRPRKLAQQIAAHTSGIEDANAEQADFDLAHKAITMIENEIKVEGSSYAFINGVSFTKTEFFEMLVELTTQAMDHASTRGDSSESGLVYHFLDERNLLR